MGVPADSTSEGKLLSSCRMLDVKRTLIALKRNSLEKKNTEFVHIFYSLIIGYLWSYRALGQLRFGDVGDSLEVVMTQVAEMGRPEAEEDGHRAAIATLVLQVVRAVLGTHLGLKMINVSQKYKN